MIVHNTHGLPQAIVQTVVPKQTPDQRRSGADISVTELIGPPRIKQLRDKYYDQLEVDVTDRIHALFGTAVHGLISRQPYSLTEVELTAQWQGFERMWNVRGSVDLIEDGILWDIKPFKAGAVMKGVKEDWALQVNIYNQLCRQNKIPIRGLKVAAYIRDYSPVERYRTAEYPKAPMIAMDVDMWSEARIMAYIQWRLTEHEKALPECTWEERWAKPNEWALMCGSQTRAVALYSTREQAEEQMRNRIAQNPKKRYWVQERVAESIRCKYYCDYWKFCNRGRIERGVDQPELPEPD